MNCKLISCKLIVFDLDDTLIDTTGSVQPAKFRLALKEMIKAGLVVPSEEDAFQLLMKINRQFSLNGKNTIFKFLEQLQKETNLSPIDVTKLADLAIKVYYGEGEIATPIDPVPGALTILKILKERYKLVLLSVGVKEFQYYKMRRAGIPKDIFKEIIIIDDYKKKQHYKQLLKRYTLTPDQILVCGDRFKVDLLPARELGMKTVHLQWGRGKVDQPYEGEVDYSITNLEELKKIIKII